MASRRVQVRLSRGRREAQASPPLRRPPEPPPREQAESAAVYEVSGSTPSVHSSVHTLGA